MKTSNVANSGMSALATTGNSLIAQQARVEVERLSQKTECVLIVGPEGSGREALARNIHAASARKDRPFVVLNCRFLSAGSFFDSQVFGHLPGAFAGLKSSSLGLIQAAHHGTLFLRDVEALDLKSQEKLFRALQEQKVTPVGGHEAIVVNVRIIASTHAKLPLSNGAGIFRDEFIQLLSENLVEVSRLVDRMEDMPALADQILREIAARRKQAPRRLSSAALDWLGRYEWPGNLRELRAAIDAAIPADSEVIDARSIRLALKELNTRSVTPVSRRSRPTRFTGFAAMRTSVVSRCHA
jgi:two-component system response regulator HydG